MSILINRQYFSRNLNSALLENQNDLISIIMTIKNPIDDWLSSVYSILGQSYNNFELIIIIDDVISETEKFNKYKFLEYLDSRIKLKASIGCGRSYALNTGLKYAKGLWIAYLDCDNWWDAHYLLLMRSEAKRLNADLIYCGQIRIIDNNCEYLMKPFDLEKLRSGNYIDINSLLHRRDIILLVEGFNTSLTRLIDYEFIWKLAESNCFFYNLPAYLCYYDDTKNINRITYSESLDENREVVKESLKNFKCNNLINNKNNIFENKKLLKIGGMATMPTRWESFEKALEHILPQIDKLYLYLDKYDHIPKELINNPKIHPILPGVNSLGSDGKFYGIHLLDQPVIYFGFDDDIIYSQNYVSHMTLALESLKYQTVIGLHGVSYHQPCNSYIRDRKVIHFRHMLEQNQNVDALGAGTIAFHTDYFNLSLNDWPYPNMGDLFVMCQAIKQNVKRVCINRPAGLITPIQESQPDSIFLATLKDDTKQTSLINEYMSLYPNAWTYSNANFM